MKARYSSSTMILTAIQRAAYQVLDDEPRILDDPVAVGLTEGCSREEILAAAQEYRTPILALRRSAFVLRSRFAEDCLRSAVSGGIRQYVILGAGLDTFAYRQPNWARNLAIFEVDHPPSQEYKRERLAARGIQIPANLRFCPFRAPVSRRSTGRNFVRPRRDDVLFLARRHSVSDSRRDRHYPALRSVAAERKRDRFPIRYPTGSHKWYRCRGLLVCGQRRGDAWGTVDHQA